MLIIVPDFKPWLTPSLASEQHLEINVVLPEPITPIIAM